MLNWNVGVADVRHIGFLSQRDVLRNRSFSSNDRGNGPVRDAHLCRGWQKRVDKDRDWGSLRWKESGKLNAFGDHWQNVMFLGASFCCCATGSSFALFIELSQRMTFLETVRNTKIQLFGV